MDVRMPDGVIVRNVPDDVTQEDLLERYQQYGGGKLGEFAAQQPSGKSVLQRVGEAATEQAPISGAIAGGLIGAATPVPGGTLVGSLIGTILGTSIGTSARQIAKNVQGTPQSVRGNVIEQSRNMNEQAIFDMLGNFIGGNVVKAFNAAMPSAREGAGTAQSALTAKGGSLSIAQAVDSPTLNLVESFARAGAGGKGRFMNLEGRNADALQAIKNELLLNISKAPASDRVAGKLFQDAINNGEAAHGVAAQALYRQFDQAVESAFVDALPIAAFGKQVTEQFKRIGNVGKTDAGGALIDQLANVPNTLTFGDAQMLRSNLLARVRDLKSSAQPDAKALRIANEAVQLVDQAMESSARQLPGNLFQQYRQISAFYRKGKEAFNNELIAGLLDKDATRVGESLFAQGNVEPIIQAKASLRQAAAHDSSINSDAVWSRLQTAFLNAKLTSKSMTSAEGETVALNLLKDLAQAKSDRQMQVMFTSTQRNAISEFARTAFLTLKNRPQQFGILAPLLQASAIGDLALGAAGSEISTKSPFADVGLLVSPYAISRVMTNPKAVSVLIKGLRLPQGVSLTGPVIAKLGAELADAMKTPQEQ